jgi:putative PIG3 family NAD(P)H quinone oxidoreductase
MDPRLPESMTAITIREPGGPEVLVPTERPVPRPAAGQILIRVEAAGINRADALQRQGNYSPPKGVPLDVPGLEVAGEVVAVGEGGDQGILGSRVTALVSGGGYSQYCVVPEGSTLPWPKGYDAVQAAALPEAMFTVWSNVFDRGRLQPGEILLVHGGASGIGTTAIQLAKAFGSTVIVTAGSPERCEKCRQLGADLAIDYKKEDFVQAVKDFTDGHGADAILDMVGGEYIGRNYRAAAVEGRIVQIAFQAGPEAQANFGALMMKRLTHTGSTLRPREDAYKAELAERLKAKVWPLLDAGQVKPIIDAVLPLTEAAEAHRRLEGGHFGKIMLKV